MLMSRSFAPTTVVAGILFALSFGLVGCSASGQDLASTSTASPSKSPTSSSTSRPTPTQIPSAVPVTPPASEPINSGPINSEPEPNPNAVDNAGYVSHAIDTVNGGALPGVEFTTAAGDIVCGITGDGGALPAGSASCTPSTWRDVLPQMPDGAPATHGVVVVRGQSQATYLHPDFFAQPARTIPILPDGKVISFEGMTCETIGASIRCSDDADGGGFLVSTEAVTFF